MMHVCDPGETSRHAAGRTLEAAETGSRYCELAVPVPTIRNCCFRPSSASTLSWWRSPSRWRSETRFAGRGVRPILIAIEAISRSAERRDDERQDPEVNVNSNDLENSANDPGAAATPVQNPASQPHGTTQDQVNEMESEGQAAKQGQSPKPLPAGSQVIQVPGQQDEKRNAT